MDPSIQFTDSSQSVAKLPPEDWRCLFCQESNAPGDSFCRKCGKVNGEAGSVKTAANFGGKRSGKRKIIFASVIVLVIAVLVASGAYYQKLQKKKEEAKDYLNFEGKAFGNSTSFINSLSTEKAIEDADDNEDLFLKKLDEEKNKSDQVLADIRVTMAKNQQAKSNSMVGETDAALKEYYMEAEEDLLAYNQLLGYETESVRESIKLKQEMEKLGTIFKSMKTPEDASNSFKSMARSLEETNGRMKQLAPPPGLEDAHKKGLAVIDKIILLVRDLAGAIDAKDEQKLVQALNNLDDFVKNDKSVKEIEQLRKFHFDQLHQKFTSLRQKADGIKTGFIRSGAEFNMDVKDINIEGW
jgi:hypothetical protein